MWVLRTQRVHGLLWPVVNTMVVPFPMHAYSIGLWAGLEW